MTIGGKKISLTTQVFVAMILGSIAGLVGGKTMTQFGFIGDVWLNCIKMIVVPMVLCTIVTGIISQDSLSSLRRVSARIIAYYVVTTVLACIVGIVVGAFAITALLIRPFAGPAFDSFSRKRLLMIAQGINAVAFVLYGIVGSVPAFIAVRLLHGIGIGCSGPLAMSLVSEYLPLGKFATGISVYSLAQTFAQVIGPGTGLWLIDVIGFQGTYLIAAALLIASVASISRVVEIPRERPPYQLKLGRMFAREAVDKALVIMLFAVAFGGTTSYLVLYGTKLGIDNLGLYFVVYALCLLVTRPLYGRLADTFGA